MAEQPLISVHELAELQGSHHLRIADTRWYLGYPDRGHGAYHKGHLPGSIYVHLDRDLSAEEGPGRHPLPDRESFASTMARRGFGDDDLIVAYDDRGGAVASRLWWMLRDIGHEKVRVLDGGITAWIEDGQPVSTAVPDPHPCEMTVGPPLTRSVDRVELSARLGKVNLLDARSADRYRGENETIDPVGGHIPTARSAPYEDNLDATGRMLGAQQLAERFVALGAEEETIVYCGSGVTACHNALAMVSAGLPEPILYPGSWSDWSTAGETAATGDQPGSI